MNKIKLSILILSSLIATACDSSVGVSNPPPLLQLIKAPEEGEILTENFVTFGWKGSDDKFVFEYELYTFDEDNAKEEYSGRLLGNNITEVTFEDLDEGKYQFWIRGTSSTIPKPQEKTRNFEVDALQGSSIMFFKTTTRMEKDDTSSIGIRMEEVDSLESFKLTISFDQRILTLISVEGGDVTKQQNIEQIITPDLSGNNLAILNDANSRGRVVVYSAFLRGGNSANYKGVPVTSAELLKLKFVGKSTGISVLSFPLIEMRNVDRSLIEVTNPRTAFVTVE
ncbi:MAG: hypothetical protein K9J12_05830 [Melioribacteraceae bacterium]|nr:hypothetical protein [Melioribacteraceae bacterium]MCF8432322.1 hypothetical protein [Melioribacteraceae bacterium]